MHVIIIITSWSVTKSIFVVCKLAHNRQKCAKYLFCKKEKLWVWNRWMAEAWTRVAIDIKLHLWITWNFMNRKNRNRRLWTTKNLEIIFETKDFPEVYYLSTLFTAYFFVVKNELYEIFLKSIHKKMGKNNWIHIKNSSGNFSVGWFEILFKCVKIRRMVYWVIYSVLLCYDRLFSYLHIDISFIIRIFIGFCPFDRM